MKSTYNSLSSMRSSPRTFFLPKDALNKLLEKISQKSPVVLPVIQEEKVHFVRFSGKNGKHIALDRIRPVENLKHFFFPMREVVAAFPSKFSKALEAQVIIGAKACDLRALEIHDKVFLDPDYVESFYKGRRDTTIIISADCPTPEKTCFCQLVDLNPFVETGSDLNITPLSAGYLFEIHSLRGQKIVDDNLEILIEADASKIDERKRIRDRAVALLEKINKKPFKKDLDRLIEKKKDLRFWQNSRDGCVECFACLDICPTCYCFLLYESAEKSKTRKAIFDRVRIWDECFRAAYGRVGGGANPRPSFTQRFRNRFECKFEYFKKYHNLYACSGCGRCSAGCTAQIDIREVVWQL